MPECIMLIASGPKYDFLSYPTNPHPPTIRAPPKNKN